MSTHPAPAPAAVHEYNLFNEWRNRTLYGASLADALTRAKTLQRPDCFADGKKIENGEIITVAAIVQPRDTTGSRRGAHSYESVIVETSDGRYLAIDARLTA